MTQPLPIRDFREQQGLTLVAFASLIGVGSKSRMSDIERGVAPCPLDVALKIEELGRQRQRPIDAGELNEDVRRSRETAVPTEAAA